MTKSRVLILAALFALFAACYQEGDKTNPTPTAPPNPVMPSNDSVVDEQAGAICPAAGPCLADYSVTLKPGETVSWIFTGAKPPTSNVQAGDVEWKSVGSHRWTSQVCNMDLCANAAGTVVFAAAP